MEGEKRSKVETIVLYPSPGIGHLISMVELGKHILCVNPHFSVAVLLLSADFNTGSTDSYIRSVEGSSSSISFIRIPPLFLSHDCSLESLTFRLIHLSNPLVHQAILSLARSSSLLSIVYDIFCTPVLEIAHQLQLPCYCFFTSGAACLACFLYFPTLHRLTLASFKDLGDTPLEIPGLPALPASAMPVPMLDRNGDAYHGCLDLTAALIRANGILINTFQALESRALQIISGGFCSPGSPTPPVFPIGPLIANEKGEGGRECLEWLASQPRQSVIFLCFGSRGLFSAAQLREIAVGLESSGQRFLWVVRSPLTEEPSKQHLHPPEPDLEALLPGGFLQRTQGQGLVLKSWAPQTAVLGHESVGGFVTHCGWNSVLEAIWEGVPMIAWPQYAEQRLNRTVLVEEMKLAMRMEEGAEDGWVEAVELERKVRSLMESGEGKELRERMDEVSKKARKALGDGGSSHATLLRLTRLWSTHRYGDGV